MTSTGTGALAVNPDSAISETANVSTDHAAEVTSTAAGTTASSSLAVDRSSMDEPPSSSTIVSEPDTLAPQPDGSSASSSATNTNTNTSSTKLDSITLRKRSSSTTASNDESFLSRLRHPDAAPVALEFKSFLAACRAQTRPISEQRKGVARFLEAIYAETLQNPVFAHITADEELNIIREGWEKLVMVKIYDIVFGAPGTDERKMTAHLNNKITAFAWIEERHFDLPFKFENPSLRIVQDELLRINNFKCPRDKLTILFNVMQIAADLIKAQKNNAGGDNLLPTLILAIIRAKPPDFISNLNFILRFRNKTELAKGNVQFCMTTMMSAVSFIYNLTLGSLTLTPEESENYTRILSSQHRSAPPKASPPIPPNPLAQVTSPSTTSPATATAADPLAVAAKSITGLTSTMFTSTVKVLGDGVGYIRSAAETAAGTVDGFTQGILDRLRDDTTFNLGTSPPTSTTGVVTSPKPTAASQKATPWTTARSGRNSLVIATAHGEEGEEIQFHHHKPAGGGASSLPSSSGIAALVAAAKSTAARSPTLQAPSEASGDDGSQDMFKAGSALSDRSLPPVPPPEQLISIDDNNGTNNTAFSPSSSNERFANPADRRAFEAALSDVERGALEDYEMQLALALSLSIQEEQKKKEEEDAMATAMLESTGSESGGGGGGVKEGMLIDVSSSTPAVEGYSVGKSGQTEEQSGQAKKDNGEEYDDEAPLSRNQPSATF